MNRPTITPPRFFVMEGNTAHAFDIETCDKCGCDCEAANAFNIHEPKAKLLKLGMKELPERLPESGYCDALEAVVCPGCYVDEPEPEPVRNRRDSPGLVRIGADRDRDREMSYEDYRELTRPEEPLGDNEDI